MPSYLVIEFDDNTQANALRAQINAASAKGKPFRAVGVFARPTKFCSCTKSRADYLDRVKSARPLRGTKYGWTICPDCRLPRFGDHYLYNLLSREKTVGPRIFEEISWINNIHQEPRPWLFRPNTMSITVLPPPK